METGLYYNRFHYYDPTTGNYIQQDPIGLAGGNPTLYGYVKNTSFETDFFGLAPWGSGQDKFITWFNKATVVDIEASIESVKTALRQGGGMHEYFPVSLASKAKSLGFTAEELLSTSLAVDHTTIMFVNVPDKKGKLHTGPHSTGKERVPGASSKASGNFHKILEKKLIAAATKQEALGIIEEMKEKYVKTICKN